MTRVLGIFHDLSNQDRATMNGGSSMTIEKEVSLHLELRRMPKQQRADRTGAKLKEAAKGLLAGPACGRDRPNTGQVAKLAGVSIGTFTSTSLTDSLSSSGFGPIGGAAPC